MPIVLCPNCNRRVAVKSYDSDVVHDCRTGVTALDDESLFALASNGTDVDGATFNRSAPNLQGIANRLNGTIGGIEGEDAESYNKWGERASTHRTQKRYTHIVLR